MHTRTSRPPNARYAVYALLLGLLVVAVGHLYLLRRLTERVLGLPLWVLVELVVVFAMMAAAWVAVRLVAGATGGAR